MSQLIESIKVENRCLQHIEWHNKRFNEARRELFGIQTAIKLEELIAIPHCLDNKVYKCRIVFQKEIKKIEFEPYQIRSVKKVKLLHAPTIDYHLKYLDRTAINDLYKLRETADDILIVQNGYITDCSYANVVFFDGSTWLTASTFLLNGTQRQRLLFEGKIKEKEIKYTDLDHFTKAKPINAMLDFETTQTFEIIK